MKYWLLPAVGEGETLAEGSVGDLVEAIPYLLDNRILPRTVLNQVLGQGLADAGMSGGVRWQPFQVDGEQYRQLVAGWKRQGKEEIEVPDWVRTHSDWTVWTTFLDLGVPIEEHRRLQRRYEEAEAQYEELKKRGSRAGLEKAHLRYLEASIELTKFQEPYILPGLADDDQHGDE